MVALLAIISERQAQRDANDPKLHGVLGSTAGRNDSWSSSGMAGSSQRTVNQMSKLPPY